MAIIVYFGLLIFIAFILIICLAVKKAKKARNVIGGGEQSVIENLALNPTDEKVIEFMNYYNAMGGDGFISKPQNFNKIRGAWIVINGSVRVSTIIKKQLRDWLMVKGLRLSGQDMEVIDNYRG